MLSRLKFKIEPLVNEMLDQIPQDILIHGKVLDPAMGGGQFVKEVERRKRAAGLTNEQIKATTFGIERNILCRNYAVNKNKLVGTYVIGNFLEMENEMEFDVIIGNPPYQSTDSAGDRKQLSHNLYSQFVQKSVDIAKDNCYVSMVIPNSWMTPASENSKAVKFEFKNIFRIYNLIALNINECAKHFNVGSSFSYFVLQKSKHRTDTKVTCRYLDKTHISNILLPENAPWVPNLLSNISIALIDRLMWSNNDVLPVNNDNFFHPVVNKTHKRDLKDEQQGQFIYPQFHTNAKDKWSDIPHANQTTKKVTFSKSGYLIPTYDNGIKGTTDAGFWIVVQNPEEGQYLINILNSKLYRFLIEINKWSGFNMPAVVQSLPNIDFTSEWTDTELYNHFNLTSEEIRYIETNIK